jgi:hypothetical protein
MPTDYSPYAQHRRQFPNLVLMDIKSPVRSHAIAVLPAVASLQALRRVSKPSAASKPMIGFGDPLLDGNPRERPWELKWAVAARDKQASKGLAPQQVAQATRKTRGVAQVAMRDGRADLTTSCSGPTPPRRRSKR